MVLDPRTGNCGFRYQDGCVELRASATVDCVRHDKRCSVSCWRMRGPQGTTSIEPMIALFYKVHWGDCDLPTLAPTKYGWGVSWQEMLCWLCCEGASRDGVLKTWEVFREDRLSKLNRMKTFRSVCGALLEGDLGDESVIQREHIPLENTWVIDERLQRNMIVIVEGTRHDETEPLYLVVNIPWDSVVPFRTWVVGRDLHTKTLFALRIPNQFRSLDSALRWTLSAEPWDEIIEI